MSEPAVDRFNVTLAVREHSAEEAAELEGQALGLIAKAKELMQRAAVCRVLAAAAGE